MNKIFYFILFVLILSLNVITRENYQNYQSLLDEKKQCCLVEKKLNKNGFYYKYSSTNCDINKVLEHDKMKLIPNSSMPIDMCNNNSSNLGSCRRSNHECIDFINKNNCMKVKGMIWDKLPCNMPLKFKNKISKRIIKMV